MQIASLKAKYVSRDEIPADVVESEKRIAEATAREEGKPEAALPKIVEGRVNGFYKDAVLTEQSSVLDSKKTVGALLSQAGVTVTAFSGDDGSVAPAVGSSGRTQDWSSYGRGSSTTPVPPSCPEAGR